MIIAQRLITPAKRHKNHDKDCALTDLERILGKVFIEIVISIDLSDDDDIDPDVATSLLEPVAALLQSATGDDRSALVDLLTECAQEETIPERRMAALDLPGALGLI